MNIYVRMELIKAKLMTMGEYVEYLNKNNLRPYEKESPDEDYRFKPNVPGYLIIRPNRYTGLFDGS